MRNSIIAPKSRLRDFGFIFIIALVIRLLYLVYIGNGEAFALNSIESPDSVNYLSAAETIRNDSNFNTTGVIIFGPGYPAFLALMEYIFGHDIIILLIAQSLISAGTSLLLTILTYALFDRKVLALATGLLNAVSPAAIKLSALLLSETIFVFFLLAGLLFFIKAIKENRLSYHLFSGLALLYAAYCRSILQYFPILMVLQLYFIRAYPETKSRRSIMTALFGPMAAIMIILVGVTGWTIHNQKTHGFGHLAFAAPTALFKATARINATGQKIDFNDAMNQLSVKLKNHPDYETDYYGTYAAFVGKEFPKAVRHHPLATIKLIIMGLVHTNNLFWGLPMLALGLWGIPLLKKESHVRSFLLLISLILYFFLFSRAIVSQGYRANYPTELFWCIPMARGLLDLFDRIKNWLTSNPARA